MHSPLHFCNEHCFTACNSIIMVTILWYIHFARKAHLVFYSVKETERTEESAGEWTILWQEHSEVKTWISMWKDRDWKKIIQEQESNTITLLQYAWHSCRCNGWLLRTTDQTLEYTNVSLALAGTQAGNFGTVQFNLKLRNGKMEHSDRSCLYIHEEC